jgi:hypothetical protein
LACEAVTVVFLVAVLVALLPFTGRSTTLSKFTFTLVTFGLTGLAVEKSFFGAVGCGVGSTGSTRGVGLGAGGAST